MMWRGWVGALSFMVVSACVQSDAVPCADGRVCPANYVCDDVHHSCATGEQLAACAGKADVDPCSYATITAGVCSDGLCVPVGCGNGVIEADEMCDDGNRLASDGCSADCQSNETCGNGVVDAVKGEACDDGNTVGNDTCQANCLSPRCGDGVIDGQYNEVCDDGSANSQLPNAHCRQNCQLGTRCGDGIIDSMNNEDCDDGNNASNDGCRFDCKSDETCGNGIIDFATGELCDDNNLVGHDGCGSCQPESPKWTQLAGGQPQGRYLTSVAYDAARGAVVMFAGDTGSFTVNAETWDWNGTTWRQADVATAPVARRGQSMAYDAARHTIVLFGGLAYNGDYVNDTWLWDGTSWKDVTQNGPKPPPREQAAMAYDAANKRVLLFAGNAVPAGGSGYVYYNDTWAWDGTKWTDVTQLVGNPAARGSAAMAYDATRNKVVMFGGHDGANTQFTETWEWSGTAWIDRSPASGPNPSPRYAHTMAFDPVRQRVVMEGGLLAASNALTADTWEWNGTSWSTQSDGPSLYNAGMAYDVVRQHMVVYGGSDGGGARFETFQRTGTTWAQANISSGGPGATRLHAMAYDAARGNVVKFGGEGVRSQGFPEEVDETLVWSHGNWLSLTPAHSPGVRKRTSLVFDGSHSKVVLFGGDGNFLGPVTLGDTWLWDGTDWTDVTSSAGTVPARYGHASAYDASHANVIIFGGVDDGGGFLNDTYAWNGTTWSLQTPATSPSPRYGHAMAYDARRGRIVLFGGWTDVNGSDRADTWEWTGTNWVDMTPPSTTPGPSGRHDTVLAYDASRGRVVLFGGWSGAYFTNDVWEWDGTQWHFLDLLPRPTTRYGMSLAYNAASADMIMFGGDDGNGAARQDTWTLRWSGTFAREGCSTGIELDGDKLTGCQDGDCYGLCTPLCYPGTSACTASAPRCGDGTCQPTENKRLCPADCGIPTVICGDFVCDSTETAASCPGDCTP